MKNLIKIFCLVALIILVWLGATVWRPALYQLSLEILKKNGNHPVVTQPAATVPTVSEQTGASQVFKWFYRNQEYSLELKLSWQLYQEYLNSPKTYEYYGDLPNNWHEDFYGMFLKPRAGDQSVSYLAGELRRLAAAAKLNADETVELAMTFVQAIPYDATRNAKTDHARYPVETLYHQQGICSDKTFLAVALLRALGYGAAIFDFPDINHSAAGIQCPAADSLANSGYCYIETTNFFPIGFLPSVDAVEQDVLGQARGSSGQFDKVFDAAVLGQIEIYQASDGQQYQGLPRIKDRVNLAQALELGTAKDKEVLDAWQAPINSKLLEVNKADDRLKECQTSGRLSGCQGEVNAYNQAAGEYNQLVDNYRLRTKLYNDKVGQYNSLLKEFYPNK